MTDWVLTNQSEATAYTGPTNPEPTRPVPLEIRSISFSKIGVPCQEEERRVQSTIDSLKIKVDAVVQIDNIKVDVNEAGTRPMVFGKSFNTFVQRPIMADDHEASSSSTTTSKYFQSSWCPSGLTRTQKRKLQRLRCLEKKG
jgi:hypothetical protein